MTRYTGGLHPSIEHYLVGKSNRKFGVLVIDEAGSKAPLSDRTTAQARTLIFSRNLGFKTILIELNPAMTPEGRTPTNTHLTDELPEDTEVFFKVGFNAFGRVDAKGKAVANNKGRSLLDASLRQAGVNELIIMGQMGDQCVRLTAVGGQERPHVVGDPVIDGATGFGYQVWTCPQIINSGSKDWLGWYDDFGVKCYTAVS